MSAGEESRRLLRILEGAAQSAHIPGLSGSRCRVKVQLIVVEIPRVVSMGDAADGAIYNHRLALENRQVLFVVRVVNQICCIAR